MNLEFSEEQTLLTNLVERFTTDHYDLIKRSDYVQSQYGFSLKNWEIMAGIGILTVPFSEKYGGMGGKAEDLICVMQPLGKAVAVEPMLALPVLTGSLLEKIGTETQKKEWIAKIISGQAHMALAHCEHAARYELGFVETIFTQTENMTTLTGKKTFVLGGEVANAYIVSAVPNAGDNISFFLVEKNADGLTKNAYRLIDGSIACELTFNDTPAAPMNGDLDDLISATSLTKIAACAEMIGLMELLLKDTITHVKTREQFGKPLSKMQVIQHRLADSHISLELCRSHLLRMAASHENQADYARIISGSKAYISQAAVALAEDAVQLHGGIGMTNELIIGHAMKRIILLSTLFGDAQTEIQRFARANVDAA